MLRGVILIGLTISAVGCAGVPQQHLAALNPEDPAYSTEACKVARTQAASYQNHTGRRAAEGAAEGLLLGPLGLPIAVYGDAKANGERKAVNAEVDRACSSTAPLSPKADQRNCRLDSTGEVVTCARGS